ncbi:MAG: hypothetical protein WA996_16700, partial [Candidatus Promineifilaceae bacterium]
MKQTKFLILIVALALVMVACGEDPTPTVAPTKEAPTEEAPPASPTEPPAVGDPLSPLSTIDFAVDPNLIDVTWEWFQRTTSEATDVLFEVPNPENYTLFF